MQHGIHTPDDRATQDAPVRPRRLTHRGRVAASALLFETDLLPLVEARRRALAFWLPQAQVFRLPDGLLLTLPAPITLRADQSPGLPFVVDGNVLIPVPLTDAERQLIPGLPERGSRGLRTISTRPETLVRVLAGEAVCLSLANIPTEDPADWLDLGEPETVTVSALAEPPAPPLTPAAVAFDPRGKLGGIPAPPDARADVLKAMASAEGRKLPPPTPPQTPEPPGFFQRLFRNLFGRDDTGQIQHGAANPGTADHLFPGSGTVSLAALSDFIGRQQADYIKKSIELFEKGNLADALRHAIPLGKGNGPDLPPFLGIPTPRDGLNIRPGESASSSSFAFMPDLFAEMRRLYREAFDKLVAAGRIEEAAFVLAELLHENDEAVAFLERHGRLKLAAEMAEARGLPPGLVVRLWFLAKERERAIRFARRTRSYADAVARLERGDTEQKDAAKALRLLWANDLAEAGDYAAAIEAAYPVPEARTLVIAWADRVIDMGGLPGVRMRARKLGLAPEQADTLREDALELLTRIAPDSISERLTYADALSRPDPLREASITPTVRVLARAAIRSVGRDMASLRSTPTAPISVDKDLISRLLPLASSGPLAVDLPIIPALPELPALLSRNPPLQIAIDANDVGSIPITDAVLLPDGRLLVALGEAGLRLTTSDGKTLTYWNQPTHTVVLADSGAAAITVARRGPDVARLGKLDIATRRLTDWCDAPVSTFAPNYDGTLWFVHTGNSLAAIDVTFPGFFALWRIPEFSGKPVAIARNRDSLAVVARCVSMRAFGHTGEVTKTVWHECWKFTMPMLEMKSRDKVSMPETISLAESFAVSPGGQVSVFMVELNESDGESYAIFVSGNNSRTEGHLPDGLSNSVSQNPPVVSENWQATIMPTFSGQIVTLYNASRVEHVAIIDPGWSERVSLHFSRTPTDTADALTICDDRGRVLTLELTTGAFLANARIR